MRLAFPLSSEYTRQSGPDSNLDFQETTSLKPFDLFPLPSEAAPRMSGSREPTKGPSWGYQRLVLEAIGSFLSTFGENRPRFLQYLSKWTFEYPHEGPDVDRDTSLMRSSAPQGSYIRTMPRAESPLLSTLRYHPPCQIAGVEYTLQRMLHSRARR